MADAVTTPQQNAKIHMEVTNALVNQVTLEVHAPETVRPQVSYLTHITLPLRHIAWIIRDVKKQYGSTLMICLLAHKVDKVACLI